jgi:hypothetical protein
VTLEARQADRELLELRAAVDDTRTVMVTDRLRDEGAVAVLDAIHG